MCVGERGLRRDGRALRAYGLFRNFWQAVYVGMVCGVLFWGKKMCDCGCEIGWEEAVAALLVA